jgi:hypothetical protein
MEKEEAVIIVDEPVIGGPLEVSKGATSPPCPGTDGGIKRWTNTSNISKTQGFLP